MIAKRDKWSGAEGRNEELYVKKEKGTWTENEWEKSIKSEVVLKMQIYLHRIQFK